MSKIGRQIGFSSFGRETSVCEEKNWKPEVGSENLWHTDGSFFLLASKKCVWFYTNLQHYEQIICVGS